MKTRKNLVAAGLSAAIALSVSATSFAQQDEGALEEVVVTGSNVARSADSPQPIVTMDRTQIQNEQSLSMSEVFRDMSITQGNYNGSGGVTVNTDNNSGAINLRGLGARATLTLLNGRRHTMGAVASSSDGFTTTDPNVLAPSIMLDRVEVLTDGASAIYGSDAVAGVVNLVTDNDFEGFEFEYSQNILSRSSDSEHSFGLRFGAQGERTGIVAGVEYVTRPETLTDGIFELSRLQKGRLLGAGQPGSFRAAPGGTGGGMGPWIADPLCEDESIGGPEYGGVTRSFGPGTRCFFRLPLNRTMISDTERTTALTVVTHEFDSGITAEFELGAATSGFSTLLNTSPVLTPVYMPIDNPGLAAYINDGIFTPRTDYYRMIGRMRKPDAANFNPTVDVKKLDTRFAASFEGDFTDSLGWEATYTRSRATYDMANRNTVLERMQNGLLGYGGATCDLGSGGASGYGPDGLAGTGDESAADPNCAWFNYAANQWAASPGDATYNSPELLDFIYADASRNGTADLDTIDLLLRGNPNDLVGYAIGYQRRTQDFTTDYDAITNAGGFAFASQPIEDYAGTITSDSVFGEAVLFLSDTLELQFAVRHEEYDTGQDSTDPKVGFLWTPSDSFALRGTWGTSFRIANPPQQFGGTTGNGSGIQISTDGGASFEDSSAGSFTRGNALLDPEVSENYSFGFTWDITDSFRFGSNYWNFEFENLIYRENPDIVALEDIEADGIFGNDPRVNTTDDQSFAVTPGASLLQWIAAPLAPGVGIVEGYRLTYTNQEFLETSGVDIELAYFVDAFGGEFGIGLDATYTLDYKITGFLASEDPGDANAIQIQDIDGVGSTNLTNNGAPVAEWKGALRLNYSNDNHFAQLTARHTSGLEQADSVVPSENKGFNTLDFIYNYQFDDLFGTGPARASLGVINLTDVEPPFDGEELSTVQTRVYDPRGRIFRFTLSKAF